MKTKKAAFSCALFLLCLKAFGTSDEMCLAPDFQAIAAAEAQVSRGSIESARTKLHALLSSRYSSVVARASYRLAEISETALQSAPNLEFEFQKILAEVQKARTAYLDVIAENDTFWSRRAAYRLLTLIDDSLATLQELAFARNAKLNISPFSVLFTHSLVDKSLQTQFAALEKEKGMLEESLRSQLHKRNSDPPLLMALEERERNGISLGFSEVVTPLWANASLNGIITKRARQFYLINKSTLTRLDRNDAISAMRMALLRPEESLAFAFALALLVDEREALPVQIVSSALKSPNEIVRLSGLYAAQKIPSHELTRTLLSLWPKGYSEKALFANAQQLLYGTKERVLLALSSHFALGRESTQHILESNVIPDTEKAWLLQFRKDKNSTAYAQALLQHPDALVRLRTQNAMRTWHS